MKRLPFLLLICAVAALGVAGCGDDNGGSDTSATTATTDTTSTDEGTTGGSGGAGASVIEVSADPSELAFQQKSLTAQAGENKIEFNNPASIPHDVKIEKGGEEIGGTDVVTDGNAEATVNLDPGRYTFFCSVPGHRQAGMEGPLTAE